jgi:uncharacterized protein (TIGR02246 family)
MTATATPSRQFDVDPTDDPMAIAATAFDRLAAAWNRADGAAFGELFAGETDFVNIRGEHHRGDARLIGQAHQAIFDTIYAGSTVEYHVDVARPLGLDAVLAVVTSRLVAPSGPLQGTNQSRISATFVRQGDDWRITAFHNTLIVDSG